MSESELTRKLEARGISRRDFIKYCGTLAATLGLSELYIPQIAAALEKAAARPSVVYLEMSLCTGCTESMVKAASPNPAELVLEILSFDYWDTIMAPAGAGAEKSLKDAIAKGGYLLLVDGAVPTKDGALVIGGKQGYDIVKEAADKAKAVVAVGTCAAFGGIPAAHPNPTEAKGVADVVADKSKVVNVSGCPVNPDWAVATIVNFLLKGKVPDLDANRRPLFIYGQTIHENCPRRGHFEAGQFVEEFGSEAEEKGWCLYKMGCKGPETGSNCPKNLWNAKTNWCVGAGAPCVGCTEPGFWDKHSSLYEREPGVRTSGIGIGDYRVNADTAGEVLGAAALAGIAAHAIGQAATGRLGKGAPEEKPANGKKKNKGGGGK